MRKKCCYTISRARTGLVRKIRKFYILQLIQIFKIRRYIHKSSILARIFNHYVISLAIWSGLGAGNTQFKMTRLTVNQKTIQNLLFHYITYPKVNFTNYRIFSISRWMSTEHYCWAFTVTQHLSRILTNDFD